MKMREKIIFHMLFGVSHDTPRTEFLDFFVLKFFSKRRKQCIKVWETELKDYPELKEQFKFESKSNYES